MTQLLSVPNIIIKPQPISAKHFDNIAPAINQNFFFDLDLSECTPNSHLPSRVFIDYFSQSIMGQLSEIIDINEPTNIASISTLLYHLTDKCQFQNSELYFCGLDFKMRNSNRVRKIFMKMTPIGNSTSRVYHVVAKDISHLFKADFYWLYRVGSIMQHYYFCSSSGNEYNRCPISDTEKKVLKSVLVGLNTEQIADRYFISTVTVSNHKQNMLKRIGVCDIVALVQLCKLCKIID